MGSKCCIPDACHQVAGSLYLAFDGDLLSKACLCDHALQEGFSKHRAADVALADKQQPSVFSCLLLPLCLLPWGRSEAGLDSSPHWIIHLLVSKLLILQAILLSFFFICSVDRSLMKLQHLLMCLSLCMHKSASAVCIQPWPINRLATWPFWLLVFLRWSEVPRSPWKGMQDTTNAVTPCMAQSLPISAELHDILMI